VPQGFPMSPVRDRIRQSRSMCLPWTGDRPVMYPPYTCAVTCLDHQAAKSACAAASEVPGRPAQTGVKNRGRSICNVRAAGPPWTEAQVKVIWLPMGTPGNWTDVPAG